MCKKVSYLVFFCILVLTSCHRSLTKAEADRSLKVLNSNLVNLISGSAEKPEIKAFWFVLNDPSSPLTLAQNHHFFQSKDYRNSIAKARGSYQWNRLQNSFEKTDTSCFIILQFPVPDMPGEKARFVVSKYKAQDCKSRPEFPIETEATMFVNEIEKLTIHHHAEVQNNLPLHIRSTVKGDDFRVDFAWDRTRKNQQGTLDFQISLKVKGFDVYNFKTNAQIEYSRQGYYFRSFNFNMQIFDHQIGGTLDYSKIDPTSPNYAALFNKYSSMEIKEEGAPLGKIVLGKTNNGELLDYFVRFKNGDEALLSSYLPLLNKLLNYKY